MTVVGSKITRSRSEKLNMNNNYIALLNADIDFSWPEEQIPEVINLWESGYSIEAISIKMERRFRDVVILLYDLALSDKIKVRKGGPFGSREDE